MYCRKLTCWKFAANYVFKAFGKIWLSTNCPLGGGTTRIGDPSGKDKTRKILSEKEKKKFKEY